ncbi:MAG: TolC family protein, partial [Nitrospinota bacterium]
ALEESRRVVEEAVKVNRRPRVDLFKVNTRVASVRQALIRRRNAEAVTQGVLAALMGLEDVTQKRRLAGPLKYAARAIDLNQSIKEALRRRPKYQAAKREVAIAERQIRVAQARRLPQVSMGLVYLGATNDEDMDRIQDDFTASLRVSLPIFTGGVLPGQVSEARARLARARERLREVRLSVSREVQESFFRVKEAEERIIAARAAVREASEALRIEQLKVQVGRGTIEDFFIAQSAELEAKTNHFSALADANIARVALRKAKGVIRQMKPQARK